MQEQLASVGKEQISAEQSLRRGTCCGLEKDQKRPEDRLSFSTAFNGINLIKQFKKKNKKRKVKVLKDKRDLFRAMSSRGLHQQRSADLEAGLKA